MNGDRTPRFLASVTSAREAADAVEGGADLIDCKDPVAGALGALSHTTVRAVVAAVSGRREVSATVGDLPMDAVALADAIGAMAATGVDFVKVGLAAGGMDKSVLRELAPALRERRVVAVLFADRTPELDAVPVLARAGFAGVMLDTADKVGPGLRAHLPAEVLRAFVLQARRAGLQCGLAGRLAREDIVPLVGLSPDVIGFRSALCDAGDRVRGLRRELVVAVRAELESAAMTGCQRGLT